MKRLLCMFIAIIMLATLPVCALAVGKDVYIYQEFYTDANCKEENHSHVDGAPVGTVTIGDKTVTVYANDYTRFIVVDGVLYELRGINSSNTYAPKSSVTIPPMPEDPEALEAWLSDWSCLFLSYGVHYHSSRIWYTSLTNHWQYCDGCGEKFNMNWHFDRDSDTVCDYCVNDIHYYTITVKEMEGGTVTVSQDKAMLNDKVLVTVKPNEGYKLQELRFYNLNEEHSQLVRYEDVPGSEYHFIVLPWDIEIEADFVKAD